MRIKTTTRIWLVAMFVCAVASKEGSFAVVAVALAWASLMSLLHVLEVKINKLLDEAGIIVTDADID